MTALIKKLPPSVELAAVLLLAFGLPIYSSMHKFFQLSSTFSSRSWFYRLTDMGFYTITIYEVIVLSVLIPFLLIRNWSLKDFNLQFSLRMVGIAFLLIIVRDIVSILSFKAFSAIHLVSPELKEVAKFKWAVTLYGIIPILVVNSIFEESIVIGYLFKRLENISGVVVISFSILIRQLYHLYQGPITFFWIIPTGLVFALYYWRYRRLTPLIIAHGMSNLFAYLGYMHNVNGGSS